MVQIGARFRGHCEICRRPGAVVEVYILDARGQHHVATVHVACEDNRVAKMRAKAAHN